MATDKTSAPPGARLAGEDFLELEMMRASKTVTGNLFHYTSAEAAMFGILATGTLRLSPFESTNDLWESRPLNPVLSVHHDDRSDSNFSDTEGIWNQIDRNIRLHTKVACLTQDIELPDHVLNPNALRGWGHLSLWAHYGAAHRGICLQFDRDKLVQAFLASTEPDALHFHGPVKYLSTGANAHDVNLGQVKRFGVDAIALAHAESNKDAIFFRKHHDWSNEAEYRLILLNQSVLPSYIDIRGALTGVVLGDAFSPSRMPALQEVLRTYPDVALSQLHYMNRTLIPMPARPVPVASPRPAASHFGSLTERLAALHAAEEEAHRLKAQAQTEYAELSGALADGVRTIASELDAWPQTEVAIHMGSTAVPEAMRRRRAGVPGERVHLEQGWMAVVENLPKYSHTFVAAAAFQVLDGSELRLHAVVSAERWDPPGNERKEHWRTEVPVSAQNAHTALATVLADLRVAVGEARASFDNVRERTAADGAPNAG